MFNRFEDVDFDQEPDKYADVDTVAQLLSVWVFPLIAFELNRTPDETFPKSEFREIPDFGIVRAWDIQEIAQYLANKVTEARTNRPGEPIGPLLEIPDNPDYFRATTDSGRTDYWVSARVIEESHGIDPRTPDHEAAIEVSGCRYPAPQLVPIPGKAQPDWRWLMSDMHEFGFAAMEKAVCEGSVEQSELDDLRKNAAGHHNDGHSC